MRKTWQQINLAGGGLQAANIRLAQRLKKRSVAYALLVFFPIGLHRVYLRDRRGPWLYVTASVVLGLLLFTSQMTPALSVAALLLACALFDAFWIDRRLAALNKQIRKEVYLSQAATPPPGYQGRTAGHEPVASFAEQERFLAAIARQKAPPKQR